ncbi:unnamed protein product [Ilex paraguariensis]|uniref:GDSL esterase/lipase n=1 Tax=Ilex paraguariensis TaxID=185542 RepID=A0ABC8S1F6_9AQUA
MGVSPLNSYLDSVGAPSFERGCNFATGGSTILPANANSISPFSFRIQVAQFVRFKARVLELLAKDKKLRKFLPSEDSFRQGLYMFDIGQNDLDAALYSKSEDQVTALIPTILAELEIGIKVLLAKDLDTMGVSPLNSYLDSVGAPSFERGCNFATGGSTILPANANSISPFSFRIQVAQFVRFKARVLELLAKDKKLRKFLPSEDSFRQGLYMFDIGQNDLDAALYSKSEDQVTALIPTILAELEIGIKTLYNEGARNFWIHNTGPLGCLPRIIAIFGKDPSTLDEVGCVKVHNHAAMLFNTQLHSLSMKFQEQLPESNVTYTDIFSIKFNLISNFSQLGFKQPLSACCGYGGPPLNFDTRIACGETKNLNGTLVTAKPCNNTDEYVNWDGNHYTEAANLFISSQILSGKYSGPASIDEYPIFSWLQVE